MLQFKLTTVGNSLGFIVPKEAQDRLKVGKGDVLFLVEVPGGYMLTPYNPTFERQMKVAEQFMREHRDALRALAQ